MQVVAEQEISQGVLNVLYADLKSFTQPGCSMENDALRYEMFARRLVAAEYGRPDAVVWALEWHAELLAKRAADEQARFEQIELRESQRAHSLAELAAGRVGNPLYQAFLDTVEEPAKLESNVDYFAFHSQRLVEFQKANDGLTFAQFVRRYADQHLSERLKAPGTKAIQSPTRSAWRY